MKISIIYSSFVFFTMLFAFATPVDRHKKKKQARLKRLRIEPSVDKNAKCTDIYKIGLKYIANPDVYHVNPADLSSDKLQLFTTIDLDQKTGIFNFKMNMDKTPEQKEANAILNFLYENEMPPKYNWFDLKGCCLKYFKYEGKEVFNEICFQLIFGFIKFRYITMTRYFEEAFREAIKNQEYVVGEIPLSDEQKRKRLEEKLKNPKTVTFSKQWMKAKNPIVIFKGGKRTVIDEDNYDFLYTDYFNLEGPYVRNLKGKLEKGCAISFFIPVLCPEIVRVCPFFFDKYYRVFDTKAKENFLSNPDSKFKNFIEDPNFFNFKCLEDGYFITCLSPEQFKADLDDDEAKKPRNIYDHDNEERTKLAVRTNEISMDTRAKSVRILYLGSVTATSDLDFTAVTYQTNMVKNYHLQRMILDNFNHRYQNDMTIKMNHDLENKCFTAGDCMDTNAYMTGFLETKYDQRQFTGIEDVDVVFRAMNDEQFTIFKETSFLMSTALGMTALTQVHEELQNLGIADKIEIENGISFEQGIVEDIKNLNLDYFFFIPLIEPIFRLLEKSESLNANVPQIPLKDSEIESVAKVLADTIKNFAKKVEEYMYDVRKIKNDLNKEIYLDNSLGKFKKSIKLNDGYTYLTLVAIEEISRIQPDFGVAMEKFSQFSLKAGVSLMYANEAYYNNGGIKYQVNGVQTPVSCSTLLEATYMIYGYDLLHFFDLYPSVKAPQVIGGEEPPGYSMFNHGDALTKLGKYFARVLDVIFSQCILYGKPNPFKVFHQDFLELGFIDDDVSKFGETGANFEDLVDSGVKQEVNMPDLYEKVRNLRIMTIFSRMSMKLKKKYGLEPLTLIKSVIELERNVLSHIKGYEIANKTKSIVVLMQLSAFVLNSMTYNYYIFQKVWDSFGPKNFGGIARLNADSKDAQVIHAPSSNIPEKKENASGSPLLTAETKTQPQNPGLVATPNNGAGGGKKPGTKVSNAESSSDADSKLSSLSITYLMRKNALMQKSNFKRLRKAKKHI